MDQVHRLLEEVWRASEEDVSARNLLSTLDIIADCEHAAAEFRADAKGMLTSGYVDMSMYAKEQELRGDEVYRLVHDAAHCLMLAKQRLREYGQGHRAGGK